MQVIKNKEDIKNFEKVHSRASAKYVPIKTSEFIENFEPQFQFKSAKQYREGSNAHYVELTKGDEISVYIENSFDCSLSLRIAFKYKDFIFGKIRQIHKGIPAIAINNNKADIYKLYEQASLTIQSMRELEFTKQEKDLIISEALKLKMKKFDNVRGFSYDTKNALDFVIGVLADIKEGNLEYRTAKGWKALRETKSQIAMVDISNAIWGCMYKKFPEFYV
jgi:hypothetical protein